MPRVRPISARPTSSSPPGSPPRPSCRQAASLRRRISPNTSASGTLQPQAAPQSGIVRPQERIGRLLYPDRAGDCGLAARAEGLDSSARRARAWLSGSMPRAKRALLSVYSWPQNSGGVGQGHQLAERPPHGGGIALEQAAAAQREQCITAEQGLAVREPVADMAPGVAGRLEYQHPLRAEPDLVAIRPR